MSQAIERTCCVCGCTESNCSRCVVRTGEPCCWVGGDLCSACACPGLGDDCHGLPCCLQAGDPSVLAGLHCDCACHD